METLSRVRAIDSIRFPSSGCRLLRQSYFVPLLVLAGTLFLAAAPGSSAYGATPASGPAASAASIIGTEAKLNGTPLTPGATLFPGDVIRVGIASTAALRFGNSLVLAAAETELVVESEGVSLRNGRVQVRANGEQSFGISGPFFQVNIGAFGGIPSSAEIQLAGTRAQVSTVAGAADVMAAGNAVPYRLRAGETATMDAAGADASPGQGPASPSAGKVSRLIPQVQIDRASDHLVAAVSDSVYWNDGLRSGPTGRAHITLKDGSQLNLGSDSSLRILQHDSQAQQTSLDLLMGRMRGKITKLTRPGAKFEIHTPVGVAGLVGTDLSLLVTNDYVELIVSDGTVRFTTLDGQSVTVTSGMKLRISRTGVLTGPLPTTPQEVQVAQDLTDITGPANQGAPVAAATARPLVPLIVTVTAGAAAVGIGVWQASRPVVSTVIP